MRASVLPFGSLLQHRRDRRQFAPEPYGVGPREMEKLRVALSSAERRKLTKDARSGANWIHEVEKKIAAAAT